ncbi:MAG: pirin family protein [Planctomycetota bacterium]
MTSSTQNLDIRRAEDRGRTRIGWLDSAHSFSFGHYFDPDRTSYRSLRVLNDDRVAPGAGFGEHGHDNMEIITWVLEGALRHGDSLDNQRELTPGEAQVMSAGTGIHHSEHNASGREGSHFLQVWIVPDRNGHEPRYDQRRFAPEGRYNRFQPIASGRGAQGALPIHQDADVLVADVTADAEIGYDLAEGRHAYLHVATGRVDLAGVGLSAGDAAVIDHPGAITLRGVEPGQAMLFDLA